MPPPRGVSCDLCGQKFFKHSLPIHRKKCEQKFALCYTECNKCLRRVSNDEYEKHASECTVVRKKLPVNSKRQKGKKAGAKPALPQIAGQLTCEHCRKSMAEESLKSHIQVCSAALAAKDEESEESSSDEEDPRQECGFCTRKFSPDRIAKHEHICSVNASRKERKQFKSSAEMRLEGTEFEKYKTKRREVVKPPSRWRQEHEKLEGMVEQGRLVAEFQKENIPLSELPPTGVNLTSYLNQLLGKTTGECKASIKSIPDGHKQCPHCDRTFAGDTAERHIPKCKTTVNKPKRLQRKSVSVLHQAKTSYLDKVIEVLQRVAESKTVKNSYYQTKEASMFSTNDRVTLKDGREGVVEYIGRVDALHPGYWIGVKLGTPNGHNDGSLFGHRYFKCAAHCGVFVRPSNLIKVIAPVETDDKLGTNDQTTNTNTGKKASGVAKQAKLKGLHASPPVPETPSPKKLAVTTSKASNSGQESRPINDETDLKSTKSSNQAKSRIRKPQSLVTKLRNEVNDATKPNNENTKPSTNTSTRKSVPGARDSKIGKLSATKNTSNQISEDAAEKEKRISKDVQFLEQLHGKMNKGERGFGGGKVAGGARLGSKKPVAQAVSLGAKHQPSSKGNHADQVNAREARAAYFDRLFGEKK